MKTVKILTLLLVLIGGPAWSQTDTIFNTAGMQHIPYYEQLYRFRVWRTIDFREKQNEAFRSPNSDLIKVLIDNLLTGVLKGYQPNDLFFTAEQSVDDFMVKRRTQGTQPYESAKEYFANETVSRDGKIYSSTANNNRNNPLSDSQWWADSGEEVEYVRPDDIPMITLVEDVIFDKRRSRLYYDILGFVLLNQDGNPLAIVSYKQFSDLMNRLSHARDMKTQTSVMWKNRYNPKMDHNFLDAFTLRLFHGIIEKVENPQDRTILEIYTENHRSYSESVFARWEADMMLLEKEHNLWEY